MVETLLDAFQAATRAHVRYMMTPWYRPRLRERRRLERNRFCVACDEVRNSMIADPTIRPRPTLEIIEAVDRGEQPSAFADERTTVLRAVE